ncbi:MAG TPA: hypothetical protein VLT32_06445 [Candidatus Sulfomarinibacteraceae bacterium]|nr:hypothetical protein [Candidatus Sulfomarinibacteraceae bacterium]
MNAGDGRVRELGPDAGSEVRRPPGVTVIPHALERRLYFLAFLVLSGWFLLDRLL